MKTHVRSTVRWRIVLIYFMLVFIAMSIASVFLTDRIENYQISVLRDNISNTVSGSNLLTYLSSFETLEEHGSEIQKALDDSWTSGFTQEISVVSPSLGIVASTNTSLAGRSAAQLFDSDAIVSCLLSGKTTESDSRTGDIPVKNLCFAVSREGSVSGVVFVRADLSSIRSFMDSTKLLLVEAIAIALVVTVLLGTTLARSITVPIQDVTEKVQLMSQGNYDIQVPVKSDDEIGQLAEMFNLLSDRLGLTITEINNEKNKLGTILQHMGDGLIAMDLCGEVIHANPAARRILGIQDESQVPRFNYRDLEEALDEKLSLDHLSRLTEDGQITWRRGSETYVVRHDRFKDEDGSDMGIILLLQDITERQKLEDMQTEFVANVSHELKTPLTNIKSYTETLLDGALDDRETADRFLEIIDKEADRMNRLVKDLLQLSRLDHQQEPIFLREGNIVLLLNSVLMKIAMTAKQKQISLCPLYDEHADVRVSLDKDRMEQVLMNILSNAIKYTDTGGCIYVDVKEEKGTVRVSVRDTGIGIPKESLPRIFERFYRVDKARSRAMGGTGLGLAITKEIIDSHNGSLEAESTEGEGTTITIVLPAVIRRGVRDVE
ncbi:MAG: HAMP domain-containing protein [Firmicutes bacterium]|nr:HAMP domain-containing protein [Bacillota bacterium]